jgi:hypothetical protein
MTKNPKRWLFYSQELVALGVDISLECRGMTAIQVALFKFMETGRPRFLRIADALKDKQMSNSEESYHNHDMYRDHPINQRMAQVRESIQHLHDRKCCEDGCGRKVVVPYEYCGGRHMCLTRMAEAAHRFEFLFGESKYSLPTMSDAVQPMSSFSIFDAMGPVQATPAVVTPTSKTGSFGAIGHPVRNPQSTFGWGKENSGPANTGDRRGNGLVPLVANIPLGTPPRPKTKLNDIQMEQHSPNTMSFGLL